VFLSGCYAAPEIAFVRSALKRGMSFVDVGANWGLFTLVAAHFVGASGSLVAIEADPRMFARLKSNVTRNGLRQVLLLELAIADRDSNVILAVHDQAGENWGISRLVEAGSPAQMTISVPAKPLDAVLDEAGLETVDLLKIDVEGAEDLVLNGMDAGLTRHRYRRILLELHPTLLATRCRSTRELTDMLRGKGYRGYAVDDSPRAVRKAYYHPWRDFSEFVRPLDPESPDHFLHTVWLSPDQPGLIPNQR
jgi:FkbM family methyltransferase